MDNQVTANSPGFGASSLHSAFALHRDTFRKLQAWTGPGAMLPPATRAGQEGRVYRKANGVAVIDISGVLEPQLSWWSWVMGGTSFAIIQEQLRAAMLDGEVETVLLKINSPGGTVDGTAETAALIRELGKSKQVVAFGEGMIASASYWLAASASKVIVTPTTDVGSISVVTTHVDMSKLEADMGVKVTEVTSGRYKRIASQHAPLNKEGRAYLQDQVDQLHVLFVEDALIKGRGMSEEDAAAVSEGQMFLGVNAKDKGLVDEVAFFDQVMEGAMSPKQYLILGGITMADVTTPVPTAHAAPAVDVDAIRAEAAKGAAVAERARIKEIRELCPIGLEAVAEELIESGESSNKAAVRFLQEQKKHQGTMLQAMKDEAPAPAQVTPLKAASDEEDGYKVSLAGALKAHNEKVEHTRAVATKAVGL